MSYHSEHKRMKPVLDLARQLDIATNPQPSAIFEAATAGFEVWCTHHGTMTTRKAGMESQ